MSRGALRVCPTFKSLKDFLSPKTQKLFPPIYFSSNTVLLCLGKGVICIHLLIWQILVLATRDESLGKNKVKQIKMVVKLQGGRFCRKILWGSVDVWFVPHVMWKKRCFCMVLKLPHVIFFFSSSNAIFWFLFQIALDWIHWLTVRLQETVTTRISLSSFTSQTILCLFFLTLEIKKCYFIINALSLCHICLSAGWSMWRLTSSWRLSTFRPL